MYGTDISVARGHRVRYSGIRNILDPRDIARLITEDPDVPGPEMNLLTNYDDTMLAMAELEGEGWLNRQLSATEDDQLTVPNMLKYIRRKQKDVEEDMAELATATDPKTIAYLERMLARWETDTVGDSIYGAGGWHRYIVQADGKDLYSAHHGRTDADKAAELGFEMF
jgi:hypothetical protein